MLIIYVLWYTCNLLAIVGSYFLYFMYESIFYNFQIKHIFTLMIYGLLFISINLHYTYCMVTDGWLITDKYSIHFNMKYKCTSITLATWHNSTILMNSSNEHKQHLVISIHMFSTMNIIFFIGFFVLVVK